MKDLVVIGGGGHARVLIEAALSRPGSWNVLGFVDPAPCADTVERLGVKRVGEDETKVATDPAFQKCLFAIGVGSVADAGARREIVNRCRLAPDQWATVIHAQAWVSPTAKLGPGVSILAGAAVNAGARIGVHSIVNTSAIVEYDVTVGDFTHVGPAAAIGARAEIGEGSYLGIGCRIRDRVKMGKNVRVGMGAVVLHSVSDGRIVIGVPAKDMARGAEQG